MLAYQNDTIAALATPPGRGGIAIVRVSGENARAYFEALFRPAGRQQVESHRLLYGHLYDADGAMLDECMAVLMLASMLAGPFGLVRSRLQPRHHLKG